MENNINVTIQRGEEIKLVFHFATQLVLNLSSDNTKETQAFFLSLLKELVASKTSIKLNLIDEVNDLYHDVAEKYLKNLDVEINKILVQLPQKIPTNV